MLKEQRTESLYLREIGECETKRKNRRRGKRKRREGSMMRTPEEEEEKKTKEVAKEYDDENGESVSSNAGCRLLVLFSTSLLLPSLTLNGVRTPENLERMSHFFF
jgi:hypothetical protein